MSDTLEEIRQIALDLPYDDRAKLAESLWESLDSQTDSQSQQVIDGALADEIARRVAEIKAGTAVTYSLEEVEERLGLRLQR